MSINRRVKQIVVHVYTKELLLGQRSEYTADTCRKMLTFKLSICSAENSRKYKLKRQKGTLVVSGEGKEVGEEGRFTKGLRDLGFTHVFTMLIGVTFHRLLSPQSSYITVLSPVPHSVILFWKQSHCGGS